MTILPALLFAAGRGERMRPLTDHTPKPLLPVHGRPLIVWHLEALARDGVREVVINTAWLEDAFPAALGDGARWGLRIRYSMEGRDHGQALETAGGIAKARPWLGEAFWMVAADIHAPDLRFDAARAAAFMSSTDLAHLVMTPNPPHHPHGDFGLDAAGRLLPHAREGVNWNYAGIGLARTTLVDGLQAGTRMALRPFLDRAIEAGRVSGEIYRGRWENVGTPDQLAALNAQPPAAGGGG